VEPRFEYRLVKEAVDALSIPWHAIPGDHDFKTGSLQLFKKYLGSRTYYSFNLDRYHLVFLNALGSGKHSRFGLGCEQMTWLTADLREAARKGLPAVLFPSKWNERKSRTANNGPKKAPS
jgi:3',5'-cyclic-AMP phosphodiesterase